MKQRIHLKGGVVFTPPYKSNMISWVEKEVGISYGRQFRLYKEENHTLYFQECINGIPVYPLGMIEIQCDEEGRLITFTVDGHFPTKEQILDEGYRLSWEKIEQLKRARIKLSDQQPFYIVEEIYIVNNLIDSSLDNFQIPTNQKITVEEAYDKLKDRYVIKPFYVFDREQRKFILGGKLGCNYGVHAVTGEIVPIEDIRKS